MIELEVADFVKTAALIVGMAFSLQIPVAFILNRIVSLNELPDRRAFWTSFPGYFLVSLAMLSMLSGLVENAFVGALMGPLTAVPGALIIHWWLRREYRSAWVDDLETLPEGMTLANSDWRIGLGGIVALIVAATIKVLFLKGGS